jgi:rhodanese-related sulfurtransferase
MTNPIPPIFTLLLGLSCSGTALAQAKQITSEIPNRLIDYPKFEKIVNRSGRLRARRRLTEPEFLKAMSEKNVVILDARTDKRYNMLHIRGAVNLPFTEFAEQTLAKVIPNKQTKILIYCNNNFLGNQAALFSKSPAASLNLSTFTSLMAYGYTNIYELGPLLDVRTTRLPFDGEHAGLKNLLAASTDWRSKMENRDVRYKFVRMVEGPDSPFAVFQETAGESVGEPLRYQAEFGVHWDGGLLIEDVNSPDKYVLAVSRRDLQDYLHPKKAAAGPALQP